MIRQSKIYLGLLALLLGVFAQANDKRERWVGYLPTMIFQHPMVASPFNREFYFNVGNSDDFQQRIIVHPSDMIIPHKNGVKIELTGTVESVSLGGKPGTKTSYSNLVMSLKSWRYIE